MTICAIESTFKLINIYIDTEKAYEGMKKLRSFNSRRVLEDMIWIMIKAASLGVQYGLVSIFGNSD